MCDNKSHRKGFNNEMSIYSDHDDISLEYLCFNWISYSKINFIGVKNDTKSFLAASNNQVFSNNQDTVVPSVEKNKLKVLT